MIIYKVFFIHTKMDIYIKPLSSDETILLYLKCLCNEVSICKYILYYKKSIEYDENMKYHIYRWVNIVGVYMFDNTKYFSSSSFILNVNIFTVKKDVNPRFYNITGISYQIINMIHQLVKIFKTNDNRWLKYQDKLFSILSCKIMDEMKI